jgi:hypothetical protein
VWGRSDYVGWFTLLWSVEMEASERVQSLGGDHRFEDGKIVEAAQIHETYEQYLQLGLIDPAS